MSECSGDHSGSAAQHISESPAPAPEPAASYEFSCRMCRTVLFREDELVAHAPPSASAQHKGFRYRRGIEGGGAAESGPACTSYFLDPDLSPWVAEESRAGGGDVAPDTIYCPKCAAKLGTQSWNGTQCSCGAWVVPAFKIMGKAVDKMSARHSNSA